jgi:hypothetical protein
MNCWRIRIYFTESRFSLNGGYIVYMELLSGHEKIITKSGNIKSGFSCNWNKKQLGNGQRPSGIKEDLLEAKVHNRL